MQTDKEIVRDYREIKEDYAFDPDIMSKENDRTARIKEIIDTKLSAVDKTIIILYADCASYRKLGERLGVSHTTIRKEVRRIREIIMKEYEGNH